MSEENKEHAFLEWCKEHCSCLEEEEIVRKLYQHHMAEELYLIAKELKRLREVEQKYKVLTNFGDLYE